MAPGLDGQKGATFRRDHSVSEQVPLLETVPAQGVSLTIQFNTVFPLNESGTCKIALKMNNAFIVLEFTASSGGETV